MPYQREKIKIAEVITRLDQGGSPEVVLALLRGLDHERYAVTLISGLTMNMADNLSENIKDKRIKFIYLPSLVRNINPVLDAIAFFKLYGIFKRERFGIVHTHTSKAGALGRLAAKLAGTPVVIYNTHGHVFYGYFNQFFNKLIMYIEKFLANFSDAIITLSKKEKDDFVSLKIAKPDKLRVIYNGIDLDKFANTQVDIKKNKKELDLPLDCPVVGLISRLEPVKDPLGFIEAAKIICSAIPNSCFLIVGDGFLRSKVEERARQLGIKEKVIFTGFREDIPEILKTLDLVVLCSLNEGLGISLIEAQAAGIPVIATQVGGIPEVVIDGETGILVLPGKPEALAKAVIGLLQDRPRLLRMGRSAQAWVRSRFSIASMLREYSDLYEKLILKNA